LRLLPGLALLFITFGLTVMVTGGFVTMASGVRLSARSPIPAFVAAAVCLTLWAVGHARRGRLLSAFAELERTASSWWRSGVIAVAVVATVVAGLFHTFSATGADASGYLSYAQLLREGHLTRSEPLATLANWPDGPAALAPLGWRSIGSDAASERATQVPTYAVGLPLLLAPLLAIGDDAAALAIPATLGIALVAIGGIAFRMAGPTAAILATVWLATSPVGLMQSIQVMSDVPVTAAWLVCWWCTMTRRPLWAGLAAALATLIRPNLAPLAVLPAAYLLRQHRSPAVPVAATMRFVVPVMLAALAVAYLQWLYFGSPFRSGYGTAAEIYDAANVAINLRRYSSWTLQTHGPWLFAAPLALVVLRRELVWLLSFAALVVCAYLVYAVFESWTYLRFVLPALAVAMIAVSTLVAALLGRLPVPARVVATAVCVLGMAASNAAVARDLGVFGYAHRQARGRLVGEQLAAFLPVNAVIVSGEQSGTMRYYTARSILRWDLIEATAMPQALERLRLNGYQVWVVLDDWEEEAFRKKLPALAAASLDYEPAVESAAGAGIRTRAWRARSMVARSSNSEYATGTTTSVRNSDSVWPPMTTTAMVRRSSAPGPVPSASGSIPPTRASVVIKIGRSRSRFASRMATPRAWPCRRRLSV
jgi:hypothetical protein